MIGYFYVQNTAADIRDFMYSVVPLMEPEGSGKIFVDLKGFRDWEGYLSALVSEISARFGPVIVAVGSNQLVAKMAFLAWENQFTHGNIGNWLKEWGIYIPQEEELGFIQQTPVEWLWPLAPEVIKLLKTLGFRRVDQVSRLPLPVLESQFGQQGYVVAQVSQGKYPYPLKRWEPEVHWNFGANLDNFQSAAQVKEVLDKLVRQLSERLQEWSKGCGGIDLFLTWGGELLVATGQFSRGIWQFMGLQTAVEQMFSQLCGGQHRLWSELTRVEIKAHRLQTVNFKQTELFTLPTATNVPTEQKAHSLQKAMRSVQTKYQQGLCWGKELPVSRREQVLLNWDPLRFCKS